MTTIVTPDQFDQPQSLSVVTPEQFDKQGFMQRTEAALQERGAEVFEAERRFATGQITGPEAGFDVLATQIRAIGDVVGEGIDFWC
jgi:hypothetical protein